MQAGQAARAVKPGRLAASSRGSRSSAADPTAHALVYGIAAVAALGAVLASGHPTVVPAFDAVLRGAFAFVITVATAQARRWSWIVLAGVAAGASRDLVSRATPDHRTSESARRWSGFGPGSP